MSTNTVAAAKQANDTGAQAGAIVRQYQGHFSEMLPAHVGAERWVRIVTGLLRRNPELARVAVANQGSLMAALLDCARLGLEPGVTYHLVPFGREITGIADYKGLIELMYNAGATTSVKCEVVHLNDLRPNPNNPTEKYPKGRPRFEWIPGEMDRPWHDPDWFGDRGEMIGVYAYAEMVDGSTSQVIFMNKAEVMKVKASSKSANGKASPWKLWEDRMWKKTVVRRLSKFVPTSAELRRDRAKDVAHVDAERVRLTKGNAVLPPLPPMPSPSASEDYDVVDAEVVEDPPVADPELADAARGLGLDGAAERDITATLIGRPVQLDELRGADRDTVLSVLRAALADPNDPRKALDGLLAAASENAAASDAES